MPSFIFKLKKHHLLYPGAVAAFAALSWAAYQLMMPPAQQRSSHTRQQTSSGEELHIGLTFSEAQSQGWLLSPLSANVEAHRASLEKPPEKPAAEHKKQRQLCEQSGQLWFEASCLKLEDFDIWLHSSKKKAQVLRRTTQSCSYSSNPRDLSQWRMAGSFVAPIDSGEHHEQWSAIYCLYAPNGQQFSHTRGSRARGADRKAFLSGRRGLVLRYCRQKLW